MGGQRKVTGDKEDACEDQDRKKQKNCISEKFGIQNDHSKILMNTNLLYLDVIHIVHAVEE